MRPSTDTEAVVWKTVLCIILLREYVAVGDGCRLWVTGGETRRAEVTKTREVLVTFASLKPTGK